MSVLQGGFHVRFRDSPSYSLPLPGIVSDVPGRLVSDSGLAASGRGDACQRNLGNRPRSGSWPYSRFSLVEESSDGCRPVIVLSLLNVCVAHSVQGRHSRFLYSCLSERGIF